MDDTKKQDSLKWLMDELFKLNQDPLSFFNGNIEQGKLLVQNIEKRINIILNIEKHISDIDLNISLLEEFLTAISKVNKAQYDLCSPKLTEISCMAITLPLKEFIKEKITELQEKALFFKNTV